MISNCRAARRARQPRFPDRRRGHAALANLTKGLARWAIATTQCQRDHPGQPRPTAVEQLFAQFAKAAEQDGEQVREEAWSKRAAPHRTRRTSANSLFPV